MNEKQFRHAERVIDRHLGRKIGKGTVTQITFRERDDGNWGHRLRVEWKKLGVGYIEGGPAVWEGERTPEYTGLRVNFPSEPLAA